MVWTSLGPSRAHYDEIMNAVNKSSRTGAAIVLVMYDEITNAVNK